MSANDWIAFPIACDLSATRYNSISMEYTDFQIRRIREFMQIGNIYLKILLLRIFQHTCIPIYRVDTLHVASHHLDAGLFRLVMIEERVIRL